MARVVLFLEHGWQIPYLTHFVPANGESLALEVLGPRDRPEPNTVAHWTQVVASGR